MALEDFSCNCPLDRTYDLDRNCFEHLYVAMYMYVTAINITPMMMSDIAM